MKNLILSLSILFIGAGAMAQYSTNLVLAGTPPATLSEWANRKEVLTYIISSMQAARFPVIVKTEIKTTDGSIIASTDLAKAKQFTISAATTVLFATDVLPLETMIFAGKYKTSLQRTGKLPADNYTICVQLVRTVDYLPVSEVKCKNFYLATTQLPILMKPYHEEVLDAKAAQTAIIFRWTPLVPRLTEPVTYRLQVFEILAGQKPVQALRSNQPLVDREIRGATQYIWQPQLLFSWAPPVGDINEDGIHKVTTGLNPGTPNVENDTLGNALNAGTGKQDERKIKQQPGFGFIWTIQTLDRAGNTITQTDGNGEARSEPIIFYVKDKQAVKALAKPIKEQVN